jgi:hypothetical protein
MIMGPSRFGPVSDCTANCRPILSSEDALHEDIANTMTSWPNDGRSQCNFNFRKSVVRRTVVEQVSSR